jgi:hypothetical protein
MFCVSGAGLAQPRGEVAAAPELAKSKRLRPQEQRRRLPRRTRRR